MGILVQWTLKMALGSALLLSGSAHAVPHQSGPGSFAVGALADLQLPAGYDWISASDVPAFMAAVQGRADGDELGILAHVDPPQYYAILKYDDSGHYLYPEMTKQDMYDLLESIRRGTEAGNETRRAQRWSVFETGDWGHAPVYDPQTHCRSWTINTTETDPQGGVLHVVNIQLQILGRDGMMSVQAACKPEDADSALADLKTVLSGFVFHAGQRFEDRPPVDNSAWDASRAAAAKEQRLYTVVLLLVLASPLLIGLAVVMVQGRRKRLIAEAEAAEAAAAAAPQRRSQAAPSMDDISPPPPQEPLT